MTPAWPTTELQAGEAAIKECGDAIALAKRLLSNPTESGLKQVLTALDQFKSSLGQLESTLASLLDAEHGEGSADSGVHICTSSSRTMASSNVSLRQALTSNLENSTRTQPHGGH